MTARNLLPPIVFVDDDDDDFFFISRLLAKAGVKNPVARMSSGVEAIRFLKRTRGSPRVPCLIVLDVKIPGLSGFDVLAWIRSQPELSGCRVMMLSGSDEEVDVRRAAELGADQYLRKFPEPEVFYRAIARTCSLEQSG